jgi:hypothetical protein
MNYNLKNWKTIVGAILAFGFFKETLTIWNQFHSFSGVLIFALLLALGSLFLMIKGLNTKKKNAI